MAVFTDIQQVPAFDHAVLTVGTFDGVHLGHKTILQEVAAHAREVGGESILITFDPHPRKLLFPDQPLGIITPLEQKLNLVRAEGIAHVVVVPFTREFSNLTAQEYISDFLVDKFRPHTIIIGYDHKFGHDRRGDLKMLEQYAAAYSYELIEIPPKLIDEAAVSSTKIRQALVAGNVADAAHMLGRNYSIKGTVVHGNKLGRTIGYPTANLQPLDADQIIPAIGIYAITAVHDKETYKGMLSIGYNPTVTDKKELRIEANLFDFDKDIYDSILELQFVKRLRDELKFESLDALVVQLHNDKEETLKILR
ncbi:MAG: bifunctional riboflavin kinase/FAD synthetase [Bacteroidota bacterium]